MSRTASTSATAHSGCFECNGSLTIWSSKNAVALAARHHDATGHATWAEQVLSIRYGAQGPAQPDMFSTVEAA